MEAFAKIVVGLGFGDEGKGITTDYLVYRKCLASRTIVVRYCGGHQAGHTVVVDGKKHIFASYCSGTLRGAQSYLSEFCCFYPPYIIREEESLFKEHNIHSPKLNIHPLAMLTTPYDIAFNRIREKRLGHGSVGVGIGTTMQRNKGPYKLYAVDLLNKDILKQKLESVRSYYNSELYPFKEAELKEYYKIVDAEMFFFLDDIAHMNVQIVPYNYLTNFRDVVFEGAQGVLLDMEHGIFPNVTYANTTSKNALAICDKLGISDIEMYYVTRCYTTRHGEGWMPNETKIELVNNQLETNVLNDWQGKFRVGELDYELLNYALACDNIYSAGHDKHLVMTCLDQRPDKEIDLTPFQMFKTITMSHSNDCKDFKTIITKNKQHV